MMNCIAAEVARNAGVCISSSEDFLRTADDQSGSVAVSCEQAPLQSRPVGSVAVRVSPGSVGFTFTLPGFWRVFRHWLLGGDTYAQCDWRLGNSQVTQRLEPARGGVSKLEAVGLQGQLAL